MNRDRFFQALSGLDDRYVAEAIRYAPEEAAGASERIVKMKAKHFITIALAAVLILALGVTAWAVNAAVTGPKEAERIAMQELEVWKELGLLNPEVNLDGTVTDVIEIKERDGGDYWYGRLFPHSYSVRCYPSQRGGSGYAVNLRVDIQTGKIMLGTVTAYPNAEDEPVDEINVEGENGLRTAHYYDIFDHIVPADMTVDRFCTLLAEYWGFSGYRIADTVEDMYYHEHLPAVDGSTPLLDLADRTGTRYLTVFFEGDQEGTPMYIQLDQFPEHVALTFGTNHGIG